MISPRFRPTISGLVITLNEERFIHDCLKSLAWVDEIIVVDAESHDRTVEIAKHFTDLVFTRPWEGFPAQRNFGLEKSMGQWVLILDAGERVTDAAREEITAWLLSSEAGSYSAVLIPRKNFFFGKWIRYGSSYPDPQYRIFKKGKVQFEENSLDTPKINGAVKQLTSPFDHITGEAVADRTRKIEREASYKAKMLLSKKHQITRSDLIFRPFVNFMKCYVLKQGYRDGIEGLICSGLASSHTFLRYSKCAELIEEQRKPSKSQFSEKDHNPSLGPSDSNP